MKRSKNFVKDIRIEKYPQTHTVPKNHFGTTTHHTRQFTADYLIVKHTYNIIRTILNIDALKRMNKLKTPDSQGDSDSFLSNNPNKSHNNYPYRINQTKSSLTPLIK